MPRRSPLWLCQTLMMWSLLAEKRRSPSALYLISVHRTETFSQAIERGKRAGAVRGLSAGLGGLEEKGRELTGEGSLVTCTFGGRVSWKIPFLWTTLTDPRGGWGAL